MYFISVRNKNDDWVNPALNSYGNHSVIVLVLMCLAALIFFAIAVYALDCAVARSDINAWSLLISVVSVIIATWLSHKFLRSIEAFWSNFAVLVVAAIVCYFMANVGNSWDSVGRWISKALAVLTGLVVAIAVLDDLLKAAAAPLGLSVVGLLVLFAGGGLYASAKR